MKEIFPKRGYKKVLINSLEGSVSIQKIASNVKDEIVETIDQMSISSKEDFLESVDFLLNTSESISIFAAYLAKLTHKYPEYASLVNFNDIETNFDLDARLLIFINLLKFLAFHITLGLNEKISLTLCLVLLGVMMNAIHNGFKTSLINHSWSNSDVFNNVLDQKGISVLTKYKIKKFLGYDMINQSDFSMIDCLYNPDITLDYEFLFSHKLFEYYRFGQVLENSQNNQLDRFIILFDELLKTKKDLSKLKSQFRLLIHYYLENDSDVFLGLNTYSYLVISKHTPELFLLVLRSFTDFQISYLFNTQSFEQMSLDHQLYLEDKFSKFSSVNSNLTFESANSLLDKLVLFYELFAEFYFPYTFHDLFFDESTDFSKIPIHTLNMMRNEILDDYKDWEGFFYDVLPFVSMNFVLFFTEQFNMLFSQDNSCDSNSKILIFNEFDPIHFDDFKLEPNNFKNDLELIFQQSEKTEFLNSIVQFLQLNVFYCSTRNLNDLFSNEIIEFLNESKLWEFFDHNFFLENSGIIMKDNIYLSLVNANHTDVLTVPEALNIYDAYSNLGFVHINNKEVCPKGSYEFEYSLENLILTANNFDQLQKYIKDFTSTCFLEVISDPKLCKKVLTCLIKHSGKIYSRINRSLLVIKAIKVLGKEAYYELILQEATVFNHKMLDPDVYRLSCFLSRNELIAFKKFDLNGFNDYFNYLNPEINFSFADKLEFNIALILSDNYRDLLTFRLSLEDFKYFINSSNLVIPINVKQVLFDHLYYSNSFEGVSDRDFLDFFNEESFSSHSYHNYIASGYTFFNSPSLTLHSNRFDITVKLYMFGVLNTRNLYDKLFLNLFSNYYFDKSLEKVLQEATLDDVKRVNFNLGSFFLVKYFHLFSSDIQLFIKSEAVFTKIDNDVSKIDNGDLLSNNIFWKNLCFFPFRIQYKFLVQVTQEQVNIFIDNNSEFLNFYWKFLKFFLNNYNETENKVFNAIPFLNVPRLKTTEDQIISLSDFEIFCALGDLEDLFKKNSSIVELMFNLMLDCELDTLKFSNQLDVILYELIDTKENCETILDLFITNYDLKILLDHMLLFDTLDKLDLQFFISRIAKIKFDIHLPYKNDDKCLEFVMGNLDKEYIFYYLSFYSKSTVLKYINFIFENIEVSEQYLSNEILIALELNQLDSKYYNILFNQLFKRNLPRNCTYEFIESVIDSYNEVEHKDIFDCLVIINKHDASVFLEYILRKECYHFLDSLKFARFSGRGLKRIIGINANVDRVYSLIGELDFLIVQIVLYLENKISLDEKNKIYVEDINCFDEFFKEINSVSEAFREPKKQPVLKSKLSRYLFAVINGFFRVYYSSGVDLEDFYDNLYNTRESELIINSSMEDFVFDTDYYNNVQDFVLPTSTLDYVVWMQENARKLKDQTFVFTEDLFDSLYNAFDLIEIPEEYRIENVVNRINNSVEGCDFNSLFIVDKKEMSDKFSKCNGLNIEFDSLTKKKIRKLSPAQIQIFEYISNYPAIIISYLSQCLFKQKHGSSVIDTYLSSVPESLIADLCLDDLCKLSFSELKEFVNNKGLSSKVLGFVSEYKKFRNFNVFDYPNYLKDEIFQVLLYFLPEGAVNSLLFFKTASDFNNWSSFSEFVLGLYEDYFSLISSNSKRLSSIRKLVGLNALEDIIEPFRDGLETRQILAHNVRNLFMEFSGFNVDACWADKYQSGIAKVVSNVSFYKFSEISVDSGMIIQRGGTLILEGESEMGESLWLVRGLNPRNDMYPNFCATSFVNNFLKSIMIKAKAVNARVCVVLDPAHSSSTNRRWVRNEYDNLVLEKVKPKQREDFIFNNYRNTPDVMFIVSEDSFNS